MDYLSKIDLKNTPEHIAIIMDGNGRWAKKQGQERLFGHNFGVDSVREALKGAEDLGVKYLTLYTFSTENWNRPKEEIDGLMNLLVTTLSTEIKELADKGIKLKVIGDIDGLPQECQKELQEAIDVTSQNDKVTLILALNYSARWELIRATQLLANRVQQGELSVNAIDSQVISNALTTQGIPDPELLIRTSGEHRVSNFLLWQIAYTEFHFTEVLWPDFKKEDLYKAVLDYQSRERRFGMVSEQLI
jgi:undecaprenyl diphosphate synthase